MARESTSNLSAFLAVARSRSFTRAAAALGVSPSALSHTIRGLEERLGLQLLTRTTRSVSVTEAGERLLQTIGPHFDGIDDALAALTALREKPAGALRLVAGYHAAETILWPAVRRLRMDYPDITAEIEADNGITDIVAERYHAGVRLGEQVDKDMIAVRIGPDMRMAVVGAPSYFAKHATPRTPQDLTSHACINLRLPTYGGFYAWEFEKGGRELKVRVEGPLAFNLARLAVEGALSGDGLAFVLEQQVEDHIADGRLIRVLADWCPPFSGYHLYYPSRRQRSPLLALLLNILRYQGGGTPQKS
jgi:DNA-binding transcriptional LysR family regulator